MFRSCELLLSQNLTGNAGTEKRLYIKLLEPNVPVIPADAPGETIMGTLYKCIGALASKRADCTYWGKWKVGVTNVAGPHTGACSIGNPAIGGPGLWMFSARSLMLDFIEHDARAGKGHSCGDDSGRAQVALTLYNVRITRRGVEALTGVGLGVARTGTSLFEAGKLISWKSDVSGADY